MDNIRFRDYRKSDKEGLLKVFEQNIPTYFAWHELKEFDDYLDHHLEDYFVIEFHEEIIGAGGLNYEDNATTAVLSWGFIHPDQQEKGIGRKFFNHRLQTARKNSGIKRLIVRTSQLTYIFYEKMGCKLLRREEDHWGKGLHLYEMEMTF